MMLRIIIFICTFFCAIKVSFSSGISSPIINIKSLVRPFEDCLVHLTTFKVFANGTSYSSPENELREQAPLFEIEPVKSIPIVLSSYKAVLPNNTSTLKGYNRLLLLPNNELSEKSAFFFNPALTKGRECYLELYSLSFWVTFNETRLFSTLLNGHYDPMIPWVNNKNRTVLDYYKGLQEEQSELSLVKHNLFHGIIAAPETGPMEYTFRFAFDLRISTSLSFANIPIYLYYMVDKFKPTKSYYIIPKGPGMTPFKFKYDCIQSFQMLLPGITHIYRENSAKSRAYIFTMHAQVTRGKIREIQTNMTAILQRPQFINFKRWMLSDAILLQIVFPNSSYESIPHFTF